MKIYDHSSPQDLPEWVEQELANMEDPPQELLARHDYLRDDFLAAIKRAAAYSCEKTAAAAAPGRGVVEVVFSFGGELLKWAQDLIDHHVLPMEGPQFAYAAARSVQSRGTKGTTREKSRGPIGRVSKNVGDCSVEIATYRPRDETEVEIEVLRRADKTQVRPLVVEVFDADGGAILPAVNVGPQDQAVRLPGPVAGVYVFRVAWQGGSTEIRVQFQ